MINRIKRWWASRSKKAQSSQTKQLSRYVLLDLEDYLANHRNQHISETDYYDLSLLPELKIEAAALVDDISYQARIDANAEVDPGYGALLTPRETALHSKLHERLSVITTIGDGVSRINTKIKEAKREMKQGKKKVADRVRAELDARFAAQRKEWADRLIALTTHKRALSAVLKDKADSRPPTVQSYFEKTRGYILTLFALGLGELTLNFDAVEAIGLGSKTLNGMIVLIASGLTAWAAHLIGHGHQTKDKLERTVGLVVAGVTFSFIALIRFTAAGTEEVVYDTTALSPLPETPFGHHIMFLLFAIALFICGTYWAYRRAKHESYWEKTEMMSKILTEISDIEGLQETLNRRIELAVKEVSEDHEIKVKTKKGRLKELKKKGITEANLFSNFIEHLWVESTTLYRSSGCDQYQDNDPKIGAPVFWLKSPPPFDLNPPPPPPPGGMGGPSSHRRPNEEPPMCNPIGFKLYE